MSESRLCQCRSVWPFVNSSADGTNLSVSEDVAFWSGEFSLVTSDLFYKGCLQNAWVMGEVRPSQRRCWTRFHDDISVGTVHQATQQIRSKIDFNHEISWAVIFFDRWETPEEWKLWFCTHSSTQEPPVYRRLLISPILITWLGLLSTGGCTRVCMN